MKRGQQIMSGTEKLQFDHDQFDLYEILPKFHGKALSSSGDIKIFCPGKQMYMYTLPHLRTKY